MQSNMRARSRESTGEGEAGRAPAGKQLTAEPFAVNLEAQWRLSTEAGSSLRA